MRTRSRRWRVVVSTLLGIGILAAVLGAVFVTSWYGIPQSSPTRSHLQFVGSSYETFPPCAVVSVSWSDENGSAVGFAVLQPGGGVRAVTCNSPVLASPSPPSRCPPSVCTTNYGGGMIVLYQNATHGTLEFCAIRGSYILAGYQVPNSLNASSDLISVNLSYSVSVIPADWYVPARAGLLILGFATPVAALAAVVESRVRGRRLRG